MNSFTSSFQMRTSRLCLICLMLPLGLCEPVWANQSSGMNVHFGTGYCTGYFEQKDLSARDSDPIQTNYDAQTYQLLIEKQVESKISATIGGEIAVVYGEDDRTQLVRHGVVTSIRYYLFGGMPLHTTGTNDVSITSYNGYGFALMLRGSYDSVGLAIADDDKPIQGSILHFQGGFDIWTKVTGQTSAGLTFGQSMGAIPTGTSGVRSYETNVLLSLRYFML